MRLMPRYSLRMLLVAFVVVAALCFWRDRPRRMADEFAAAIVAKDRTALQAMGVKLHWLPKIYDVGRGAVVTIDREPQTIGDWLKGRSAVMFHVRGEDARLDVTGIVTAYRVSINSATHTDLKKHREWLAERERERTLAREEWLLERERAKEERARKRSEAQQIAPGQ